MKEKIFNHVAITINYSSDIKNFYLDILRLEIKRKFALPKTISNQIFNIKENTEVIVVGKKDFAMELFIADETNYRNFQHTCITVNDRKQVIKKAQKSNYPCIIIKRDTSDIVFIKDKSNNLFEIKQSSNQE